MTARPLLHVSLSVLDVSHLSISYSTHMKYRASQKGTEIRQFCGIVSYEVFLEIHPGVHVQGSMSERELLDT